MQQSGWLAGLLSIIVPFLGDKTSSVILGEVREGERGWWCTLYIYIYIYIYEWIVRPGINLETTSTLYVFGLAVSIIT